MGPPVAELLEKLDARVESVIRKHEVCCHPERVDRVSLAGLILAGGLILADCWSRLCRRLALLVPHEADLQTRRTPEPQR